MIADIHYRLEEKLFQPFVIVSTDGKRYTVASRKHVSFDPRKTRIRVWFDDDSGVTLEGLNIATIEDAPISLPDCLSC